jgi:predicted glycoside hydrolase/deacetylase ChbG (UPF0249 family)
MIKIIINADDFGYSKIFNEKILELLEKGFVKSTTVLIKRVGKDQSGQTKRLIELHESKKIGVGLHLDLDLEKPTRPGIEEQYRKFVSVFGFTPSHLDVHKIIGNKPVVEEINRFAEEHGLPVRNHGIPSNAKHTTHEVLLASGVAGGKAWNLKLDDLTAFLQGLKDGSSCEIATHPGDYDPGSKSGLNKERRADYENIIKLQDFLKSHKNFKIISYLEL